MTLGRAVTLMKYLASVVSVTFAPKLLIFNKILVRQSNSMNIAELVVNELAKRIFKSSNLPSLLITAYCKTLLIAFYNYQSSSFVGEESWNENL